jgi:O-antigen/teichoic acid export membrane protein
MLKILKGFITKYIKDERSLKATKNIIFSFVIKAVTISISLMLVPMTINYVNPLKYGIWLTLSSVISWISLFDLGFANGLRNKLAEAKATNNIEIAQHYVSTTYAALTVIFLFIWISFAIVNPFLNWSKILNAPAALENELSTLSIIFIGAFCMQAVLKIINFILIADQYPAKAAFWDMIGQFLSLISIGILIKTTSESLIYLGIALGIVPLISVIVSSVYCYRKSYKYLRPRWRFVKIKYARNILTLGFKFFLLQIGALIIYQTTNIIIAQLSTPEQVTVYNIAYRYFSILFMIFTIIITPFWSSFTDAYIKRDVHWMKSTTQKLKLLFFGLTALGIIMLLISSWIYKLWIGTSVSIPFSVSLSVLLYIIVLIWSQLFTFPINGIGKVQLQLYITIFESLVNIPLALILGSHFGINGIIVSPVISLSLRVIIAPIQLKKLINYNAHNLWYR